MGKLTSSKAKEILHDKSVHGHPLTEKQRKFFGAIAGGAKPYKAEEGGWLDKYEQGGLVLKQKKHDNYGTKPNVNDDKATYPDGFVGWEYDITGRNYSPAWGGQFQDGGNLMPAMAGANQTVPMFQMGGSLPGAVGFTYARTVGAAPSNGPYAKKTKASAQNGMEMKYYQEGLDFKPKTISQDGSAIRMIPRATGDIQGPKIDPRMSSNIAAAQERDRQAQMRAKQEFVGPAAPRTAEHEAYRKRKLANVAATNPEVRLNDSGELETSPYGNFMKSYGKNLDKFATSWETPLAIEGAISGAASLIKGGRQLYNAITKESSVIGLPQKGEMIRHPFTGKHVPIEEVSHDVERFFPKGVEEGGPGYTAAVGSDYWKGLKENPGMTSFGKQKGGYAMIKHSTDTERRDLAIPLSELDKYRIKSGKKQDGGEIPVDANGYWNPENWGNPVIIPSTDITMEGVDQPLIGISDTGDTQYMEPGEDYQFDGDYVTEYPVAKEGISVNNADAQPVKKLDQLLNFTNYNKPTKGGWLDKYN